MTPARLAKFIAAGRKANDGLFFRKHVEKLPETHAEFIARKMAIAKYLKAGGKITKCPTMWAGMS